MKALVTLWQFSRPHTIIGSLLSISTLYVLATTDTGIQAHLPTYLLVLGAALACNVCITGLNQVVDVELDKVNKPFLPIAAGRLSIQDARVIVFASLVVSLVLAAIVSHYYLGLLVVITTIGYIYSAPPIRLKQHHLPASLCIVVVRGILVNLGIGLLLEWLINGRMRDGHVLIPLTVFISSFSLAIAWFKDLYDIDGDRQYNVKTFAILYSIKLAYWIGGSIVIAAYLASIWWGYHEIKSTFFVVAHLVMLVAFVVHLITSDITHRAGIYRFYMVFWVFFFVEYGIYIVYGLSI